MNPEILCLRWDAPELRSVLARGKLDRGGESWVVLPREVVRKTSLLEVAGVDSVVFEMIQKSRFVRPSFAFSVSQAIRPESLALTLLPSIAVLFYGYLQAWTLDRPVVFFALLGVLFFHISVNLLNDVEDHLRLIDLPGTLGGSGVIQKGWLSAKQVQILGYISLLLGVLLGLPAVLKNPHTLLVVGAFGALGVLGYSGKPFGIKYRVVGDLGLFFLLGPLLSVGICQSAFEKVDLAVILIGTFFGFVSWGVSHASNIPDIESDTFSGIHTLASTVGFKFSRHILSGLYFLAYSSIINGVVLGILPRSVFFTILAGVPAVALILVKIYRAAGPASALLGRIRFDAAKVHFLLGSLVCLGLLAACLWR